MPKRFSKIFKNAQYKLRIFKKNISIFYMVPSTFSHSSNRFEEFFEVFENILVKHSKIQKMHSQEVGAGPLPSKIYQRFDENSIDNFTLDNCMHPVA